MTHRYLAIILAVLLTAVAGCSKKQVPDPPTAQAELTSRLFAALQDQRYDEALVILDKLQVLAPDDATLGTMKEIRDNVIASRCNKKVQGLIDQGKLDQAFNIVRNENKTYPGVEDLINLEKNLDELRTLQQKADHLANAKTSAELDAALKDIEYTAQDYPQAKKLHADIKVRKAQLAKMRKAEAEAREKAEREARMKAAEERRKAVEAARKKAREEAQARADAAAKAAREEAGKEESAKPAGDPEFIGPQPRQSKQ